MRWVLCFLIVIAGCVASIPSDHGLTADIAAEAARMVVQARQGMPPAPKPESDDCENCEDGWLGDGRIKVKCPICGGTGKKPKSVLVKPAPCPNGVCPR